MAAISDQIDQTLRRDDPDRWLSSRFIADPAQRADVVALYALDHELSQAGQSAREPLAAEIRLTWWRDAIEALFAGKPPPGHPVLAALDLAIGRRSLAFAPFEAMIEARIYDLDGTRFESVAALEHHVDATSGATMALAVAVLAGTDALAVRPVAQAWGLSNIVRWEPDRAPEGWDAASAARAGLAQSRAAAASLPVAAFPAVAHLALVAPYLAGRRPLGLEKRLRMTWAVVAGRI